MISFIKAFFTILVLLIALFVLSSFLPMAGFIVALILLALSFVALIKPLPKLWLGKRIFSFCVLLFAALPGLLFGTTYNQIADFAELRETNPEAYLEQLKDTNHTRYMDELKLLKPDEHNKIVLEKKVLDEKLRIGREQENARLQKIADRKEKTRKIARNKFQARKVAAQQQKTDNLKRIADKLDNPNSLSVYCKGMAQIKAAYAKANELYDNDNDKWYEFTSSQDRALTERISRQLGLPKEDWLYYASKHHWEQKCKTGNQQSSAPQSSTSGWQEVLNTDLKAAELNNAQAAMVALKDAFGQLAKGHYHAVLNANNFQTAKCMVIKGGAYKFAGCRLFGNANGIARTSGAYIFEIGKTKNGSIVVLPFSGDEEEILRSIEPVIEGYNVLPGVYVDIMPIRDMDVASIKSQFKRRL